MNELLNWLRNNLGDEIEIITPQFDRKKELAYKFVPQNDEQFYSIIKDAPMKILKGLGFGKWETMNNIITENKGRNASQIVNIPIINSQDTCSIDIGIGNCPTELLLTDEDILLFPAEWYGIIPDGFIVTGLNSESYPFQKNKTDDDRRFGCLAYGIRRKVE